MTTPLNLGDLAFTAECFPLKVTDPKDPKRDMREVQDWIKDYIADTANRILAEKLAKAPEVYAYFDEDGDIGPDNWKCRLNDYYHTHTARLVCIKSLGCDGVSLLDDDGILRCTSCGYIGHH